MKVEYIDHMGSDLRVVNAARRSFNTVKTELDDKDINLIQFLARGMMSNELDDLLQKLVDCEDKDVILYHINKYRDTPEHWVPFAHCWVTFHVEMPIFVARQLIRHTVGVVISEMSRRYVDSNPDYYWPDEWRKKADNKKQGSSDDIVDMSKEFSEQAFEQEMNDLYRLMVDQYKVAPEMARMILPQNVYTDWYWTISMVTAARICRQRLDPHAQKETRMIAEKIDEIMRGLSFPHSWQALMNRGSKWQE